MRDSGYWDGKRWVNNNPRYFKLKDGFVQDPKKSIESYDVSDVLEEIKSCGCPVDQEC